MRSCITYHRICKKAFFLASVFDILTATLFPHFMHFLFLNFNPSKLLQVHRLLAFDEYDNIIVVILVRVGFIILVGNFRQCVCRICNE